MLRKRISTLALVVMMGISVVGCQSSKEAELENRVQQLEQQLEEQQEKDAENVTAGEYLEQHKGDASAEIDTTKTGKTRADGRKARYTANGVFVGYFTDAEVKQLNKGIQEAIDKEFKRQQNTTKQDDNTNSDVDERNNYKPADSNYDEDYWKTDGDLPNGDYDDNDEPAIIEEEEQPTFTEDNTVHWIDETNGTDEYISNDEAQERMDNIDKQNEQIQQQIEQSQNIESNVEE